MQDRPQDQLYGSLMTPSVTNTYSIGLEYIKKWFFSKFRDGYFKTIYVNQKHPLDEFRNFKITKGLKKMKPSVAISPQLAFDYDRDYVDLYQNDITDYVRRAKTRNTFFSDNEKNLHLSTLFELLEINFNFTIRVSTRAQQIDLYKYMMLALRFGSTQGEDLTMDCHIPYAMMAQLAQDAGFELKDNKIVDVIGFVRYLNQHSDLPILYKYRTINAKDEFFLRVADLYTHINTIEKPTADDGERSGQLTTNYSIEFPVVLRIPAPQFYVYHSVYKPELMDTVAKENEGDTVGLYSLKIPDIPDCDEHGWNQYMTTEYYSDNINEEIDIEMEELFSSSDIYRVIQYTKDILISPSIFMNIKLYNNGNNISYNIDWNTFKIHTNVPIYNHNVQIVLYTDMEYVKSVVFNQENFNNRISENDRKDGWK